MLLRHPLALDFRSKTQLKSRLFSRSEGMNPNTLRWVESRLEGGPNTFFEVALESFGGWLPQHLKALLESSKLTDPSANGSPVQQTRGPADLQEIYGRDVHLQLSPRLHFPCSQKLQIFILTIGHPPPPPPEPEPSPPQAPPPTTGG